MLEFAKTKVINLYIFINLSRYITYCDARKVDACSSWDVYCLKGKYNVQS